MSESPRPRIAMLTEEGADGPQLEALRRAKQRYGWLPNTMRVMVRSGSAAELYLDADERNDATRLSPVERELVAVTTAEHNSCEYCLAAHRVSLMALGASRDEVLAAAHGSSNDARKEAIMVFARAVLAERGKVDDEQIAAALQAGLKEDELLDVVAVVAENVLGNYVNNLAGTPVDGVVARAARRLELPLAGEVAA